MTDLHVLFTGDSFTAGVGDPQGRGWVGRVVEAVLAAGLPLRAYNLGIGGDTSTQVIGRFADEAGNRTAPGVDMRVVVSFGANDTTVEEGAPRVASSTSIANLETILDAPDMRAFVIGPGPVGDHAQDRRSARLEAAFASSCEQRGVPFVPVLDALLADGTWRAEAAAGDGTHPAAGGYDRLARLVLDGGLLEWLRG